MRSVDKRGIARGAVAAQARLELAHIGLAERRCMVHERVGGYTRNRAPSGTSSHRTSIQTQVSRHYRMSGQGKRFGNTLEYLDRLTKRKVRLHATLGTWPLCIALHKSVLCQPEICVDIVCACQDDSHCLHAIRDV